jgi:hypothetical protein
LTERAQILPTNKRRGKTSRPFSSGVLMRA